MTSTNEDESDRDSYDSSVKGCSVCALGSRTSWLSSVLPPSMSNYISRIMSAHLAPAFRKTSHAGELLGVDVKLMNFRSLDGVRAQDRSFRRPPGK